MSGINHVWTHSYAVVLVVISVCLGGCMSTPLMPPSSSVSGSPTQSSEAVAHNPDGCWFPGIAVAGCDELLSVSGDTPAGVGDATVAGAVHVQSHGQFSDGNLDIFIKIGECQQWSLHVRVASDVWYPEDAALLASGCVQDPGTSSAGPAGDQSSLLGTWVTDLITHPFRVGIHGADTIRFSSLGDASLIDFTWVN